MWNPSASGLLPRFHSNQWDLCHCFTWEKSWITDRTELEPELSCMQVYLSTARSLRKQLSVYILVSCDEVKVMRSVQPRLNWSCKGKRKKWSLVSEGAIKPCNHWLSVCNCSYRFKGDVQYVIKRGHEFIKTRFHYKACYFTQLSAPLYQPTILICCAAFSKQNAVTYFSALWHAGALLLGCLSSCQRAAKRAALPHLPWRCSGGGCRPGSSPDQCWPNRGLHPQPLPHFQCQRTSSGKLPACSTSVSLMKSPVSIPQQ